MSQSLSVPQLPRVGFGCEQLGGYAWGDVSTAQIRRAIGMALDEGVTLFDTADVYGLGASEERLGEALGPARSRALIVTKGGVRFDESRKVFYDCSAAWLTSALEASLRRLRTDYVDVYVAHYWDGRTPWDELFRTLESFVESGKARAYGISNAFPELPHPLPERCLIVQSEFSLANRSREAALRRTLAGSSARPTFYGCLGQGILTGKYAGKPASPDDRRSSARYVNFHGDRLRRNLELVERLKEIARALNRPVAQVALRWILDYWPESTILAGIKSTEQLRDLAACREWSLPEDLVADLERRSRS